MDLALAFHIPDGTLAEVLTEEDFSRWFAYSRKKMLPQRSIELYLAQVALTLATVMGGGQDLRLQDFLFDVRLSEPTPEDPEELLEMAREAFDFKPRNARK